MCIADWVLRYLQVLLTWPVVTLILGLISLKWLKKPLSDFFGRIRSAEGYGVRLDAVDPSLQKKESQEIEKPRSGNELFEWVKKNPEAAATDYARFVNGYWWERALNLIYGSQLELLEHLESKGDAGEKYVNLVPFFEEFRIRGGPPATQMADYLAFLLNFDLLQYSNTSGEHLVKITPFGVNFLSYARAEHPGRYKLKPL